MRVAYLNASGQLGGAETSLIEMLSAIRRARPAWELSVVLGSSGPLIGKLEELGVQVNLLPFPPRLAKLGDGKFSLLKLTASLLDIIRYGLSLARVLRTLRPDLIHAAGFKMQVLACWAKPRGVPLLWHIHDFVGSRRVMSRLLRFHAPRCSLAIANSQTVARDLRKVCRGLTARVVYNVVDPRRFTAEGAAVNLDRLSSLPPAPTETIRVGLLATFAKWKGHSVFLEAMSLIAAELPVRGYVVGGPIYQTDGSQRTLEQLREETVRLNLRDRVGFAGFVEDSASALRALDIVVHASTEPEPFGMVIIEGMACGRPVVAALGGGAAEILEHEETGLGHRPGDAQDLALQIKRLVLDPDLSRRLAEAGRLSARNRFCPERLIECLMPIYAGLTKRVV